MFASLCAALFACQPASASICQAMSPCLPTSQWHYLSASATVFSSQSVPLPLLASQRHCISQSTSARVCQLASDTVLASQSGPSCLPASQYHRVNLPAIVSKFALQPVPPRFQIVPLCLPASASHSLAASTPVFASLCHSVWQPTSALPCLPVNQCHRFCQPVSQCFQPASETLFASQPNGAV